MKMPAIYRTMVFVLLLTLAVSGTGFAQGSEVARESFTVNLGGFESQGELTYPAKGEGPFPAVILVHGSGTADMDFTVSEFDYVTGAMRELSANFRDIAEHLSAAGYAVIRYNKRFVYGPNAADWMRYSLEVDLPTLADDVETVLAFAKAHPLVASDAIYLYGWSEGSTVAAQVAVDSPDVAGLMLQTPVALSWRETFEFQMYDVGIPHLRSVVGHEMVTDEGLLALFNSDGGMVAKSIGSYIVDPVVAQTGALRINPMLDQNGDGGLSIDDEIVPNLGAILDSAFGPGGYFHMYAPEQALPVLLEQVESLDVPILILQGEQDANTPLRGAILLAEALEAQGADVTLRVYPGLGHSLGKAASLVADNFAPIEVQPLKDTVTWLDGLR